MSKSTSTAFAATETWLEFAKRLNPDSQLLTLLSPAERQVMLQVKLGLSNKEIAEALGKSAATVKAQVASVLHKLEIPTRCRLIAWLYSQPEKGGTP